MKGILLLICLFSFVLTQAQTGKCSIVSPDSIAFYIVVDGRQLSDTADFTAEFEVNSNSPSLAITTNDSISKALQQTLELESNHFTTFELTLLRDQLVLLETSSSPLLSTKMPSDDNIESFPLEVSPADTLLDSTIVVSPQNLAFAKLVEQLEKQFFESDKQKMVIKYAQENTITVVEVTELLAFFEFEDRKLGILKAVKSQVIDFEQNKGKLEANFLLEESLNELRRL